MAYELGTAWVQLAVDTKGAVKDITKDLNGIDTSSMGSNITSSIGQSFKTVAAVGAAAIGTMGAAVTGLAAKGGIDRALAIENAQAKLTGLGHSAADT